MRASKEKQNRVTPYQSHILQSRNPRQISAEYFESQTTEQSTVLMLSILPHVPGEKRERNSENTSSQIVTMQLTLIGLSFLHLLQRRLRDAPL